MMSHCIKNYFIEKIVWCYSVIGFFFVFKEYLQSILCGIISKVDTYKHKETSTMKDMRRGRSSSDRSQNLFFNLFSAI